MSAAAATATQATGPASARHGLAYNPALDGLRGIAILLVVPVHLHVLPGGRFGVDIFFALSGFLITEVIRASLGTPGWFPGFYLRRFLRLFPALAALCALVGLAFLVFPNGRFLPDDALASILYVQSWTSASGDAFAVYLGHTWSLSVEEQFYLVWPALFWMVSRASPWPRGGDWLAFLAATGLVAAGFAWARHIQATQGYDRAYFAADTRSFAIMAGAAAAAWRHVPLGHRLAARLLHAASVPALLAMLGISLLPDWDETLSLCVAALTCIVILSAVQPGASPCRAVLSLPPLVWVGRISYSLYLWHVPILAVLILDARLSTPMAALIGLPASVLMACLSHYALERPCIAARSRIGPARQVALGWLALAASVLSIATGLAVFKGSDLIEWLHPRPAVVLGYGPQTMRLGETSMLQPDGTLAVWVKLDRRPAQRSSAIIDGVRAQTVTSRDGIVVIVPKAIAATPGRHPIAIYTMEGAPEIPPFVVEILPAAARP